MDGNELENCSNCKKEIKDQYYTCDLCVKKIHKNCTRLATTEIKCMPLQKRVLTLLCLNCKDFLAKAPDLVGLINQMSNEIRELKNEMAELKTEFKANKLNLSNETTNYADVLKKAKNTNSDNKKKTPCLCYS